MPANPIAEGVEDTQVAELVVIFPTNVCEYDVLDYFPFADLE